MHEPDFWTASAEAMELSIEGNRLIATEIANGAKSLWQRMIRAFDELVRSMNQHRHLPPI